MLKFSHLYTFVFIVGVHFSTVLAQNLLARTCQISTLEGPLIQQNVVTSKSDGKPYILPGLQGRMCTTPECTVGDLVVFKCAGPMPNYGYIHTICTHEGWSRFNRQCEDPIIPNSEEPGFIVGLFIFILTVMSSISAIVLSHCLHEDVYTQCEEDRNTNESARANDAASPGCSHQDSTKSSKHAVADIKSSKSVKHVKHASGHSQDSPRKSVAHTHEGAVKHAQERSQERNQETMKRTKNRTRAATLPRLLGKRSKEKLTNESYLSTSSQGSSIASRSFGQVVFPTISRKELHEKQSSKPDSVHVTLANAPGIKPGPSFGGKAAETKALPTLDKRKGTILAKPLADIKVVNQYEYDEYDDAGKKLPRI